MSTVSELFIGITLFVLLLLVTGELVTPYLSDNSTTVRSALVLCMPSDDFEASLNDDYCHVVVQNPQIYEVRADQVCIIQTAVCRRTEQLRRKFSLLEVMYDEEFNVWLEQVGDSRVLL